MAVSGVGWRMVKGAPHRVSNDSASGQSSPVRLKQVATVCHMFSRAHACLTRLLTDCIYQEMELGQLGYVTGRPLPFFWTRFGSELTDRYDETRLPDAIKAIVDSIFHRLTSFDSSFPSSPCLSPSIYLFLISHPL